MQGHEKNSKNKNNVVVHLSSNMVVIIYCYIGCKDKATTWYLNGFSEGSNLGPIIVQSRGPRGGSNLGPIV